MLIDKLAQFCDSSTDVVINAGNAIAGDVIDLGSVPTLRDLGNGQPLYWVIRVVTAFSDAVDDTATVKFDLYTDSVAALTTSATTHLTTGAVAVGTLVAGYTMVYPLPLGATYERYMGMWETVADHNLDGGAIEAFISADPCGWVALPDAI
jgi:hypothetical protein